VAKNTPDVKAQLRELAETGLEKVRQERQAIHDERETVLKGFAEREAPLAEQEATFENTLATLDGKPLPRKPRDGRRTHAHRRPRGGTTRADEALTLVREAGPEGITIHEIADKMGIKQNYLYRILPDLEKQGLVVKEGHNYRIKSQDGAATVEPVANGSELETVSA
jgi:predicted Rossmann fold nucleotide-binding protein DprA/Smf involved in DNA uptake